MRGTVFRTANFEVFELSPTGTPERLLARLSVFEDAKAIAEIAKGNPRVVVHFGEIVWPGPQPFDRGSRASFISS
jgi:hypothetical protein